MESLIRRVQERHVFVVCVAYFLLYMSLMVVIYLRPARHAAIFGSFWEAGKHLDYLPHPLVWRTGEGFLELNLNPPTMFPLFQLFALFDPQEGQIAWMVFSAALYLGIAWTLRKQATRAQIFWLLTMPTVYAGIALGQVYVLLFALGAAIWWALRNDRPTLAAVLVGILIAMKPNFAVWVPLAFLARHYRPAIKATGVSAILFAIAAVLYGPSIYVEWLHAAAADNHGLHPHDVTIIGFFTRLGLVGGWLAAGGLLLGLAAWAFRFRPSLYDLTPVAIIGAVLCSPLAWLDYVIVAAPFFIDRPWRASSALAAFLIYLSYWSGIGLQQRSFAWIAVMSTALILPPIMMLMEFMKRATIASAGETEPWNGPAALPSS